MAEADDAAEMVDINNHRSPSDKPHSDNHSTDATDTNSVVKDTESEATKNDSHTDNECETRKDTADDSTKRGSKRDMGEIDDESKDDRKSARSDMDTDDAKSDDDEFLDAMAGAGAQCVKLKKDDSGIEIEKSPSKDSSVPSENDETTNQDESGTDVSDSRDFPHLSGDESSSEPANQSAESGSANQRRRRRRISSTSSEHDGDELTMKDSDDDDESSDDEMDFEPVVGEPKPHQIYNVIRGRECGLRNHVSPLNFTETISSNLALVQRLELQYKLDQHNGCVNALHFSQNGNLLASGSDDLKVIVWDWCHQKPALMFDSGHRNNVFQAKFLPYSGDCHVVTCARDGQVRLAELSTTGVCKTTKKLAQHKGAAHKLALEMDSPHIFLSCGEDGVTFQIDLREEKPNKLLITKENDTRVPIYSIHSNPCSSYEFCLAGRDKYIRIYDKRRVRGQDDSGNGQELTLKKFCPQHMVDRDNKCNVTCAVFNYNGTEVIGSYNDDDIYLFDTSHSDGADYTKKYHGHRNNATVKGVNFYGPKSDYIVSGSDCGNIYLWERESEKVVQFFRGDEGGVVNVLEPHPYGPFLATSGLDSDVKIWAPTAQEPSVMKTLRSTMKKNRKERRADRVNEPDMLDGQAIWLLMQHLRRTVRRREHTGDDEDSDNADSNSDSDSDSDNSDGVPDQCNPS